MHLILCISLHVLHSRHLILGISFYASYCMDLLWYILLNASHFMHVSPGISLYLSYLMHIILWNYTFAAHSLQFILCIIFYAYHPSILFYTSHSRNLIIYTILYVSHYMHLIIIILFYAYQNILWNLLLANRQKDQQTDGPTLSGMKLLLQNKLMHLHIESFISNSS